MTSGKAMRTVKRVLIVTMAIGLGTLGISRHGRQLATISEAAAVACFSTYFVRCRLYLIRTAGLNLWA